MVLMLAVESVRRKCEMQASVLVGNYEFYYAAGRLAALCGKDNPGLFAAGETASPAELKEAVMSALEKFAPSDEKESYLARMLERYRPGETWDDQTRELFVMGKEELRE